MEFWTCRQSFSFATCCGFRTNTKICISAAKVCFFTLHLYRCLLHYSETWQTQRCLRQATLMLVSVQSTCCIVNSPSVAQSKITKHNPGLKLFRLNQNAAHSPKFRASRSSLLFVPGGALNPPAIPHWIQWNGLTHCRFSRSALALLALTIDEEEQAIKRGPQRFTLHFLGVNGRKETYKGRGWELK